jgi:hypothetical protein
VGTRLIQQGLLLQPRHKEEEADGVQRVANERMVANGPACRVAQGAWSCASGQLCVFQGLDALAVDTGCVHAPIIPGRPGFSATSMRKLFFSKRP